MRWTDRQVAMLAAMGVRLWQRPVASDEAAVAVVDAPPVARAAAGATDDGLQRHAPVDAPFGRTDTPQPGAVAREIVRPDAPDDHRGGNPATPARPAMPAVLALRDAVATCTACPLCAGRTHAVFGSGRPRADWMIVGEAPSEAEDRDGASFVGPPGLLLDNMLRALGLSRAEADAAGDADPARRAYVTNLVKCRPPGDRAPTADEVARCEAHLVRQIELVQPRMLLVMGRFAAAMLLRSNEPIGRLRGRVHRLHGTPLVVTYHPSVLLRNLPEKAKAWDDLCLAAEALAAGAVA